MAPEIASVFQICNVGVEVTNGTPVASNKRLSALMIEPQIKTDIKKYRGSGYKFPAIASMNKEWIEAKLSGPITYTEIIYLLSSILGTTTPVTGTTDQTWTFAMLPTAADTPKTFTVEYGDATRALKWSYGLVNDLTLSFDRDGCELSGTMLGQAMTDAITLTASPAAIALTPVFATHVAVQLADTQAALGAAADLLRVVSCEWALSDRFNPAFFLNASVNWTVHVEQVPKLAVKLKMEKDAAGMGLITQMRAGSTKFMAIEAIGAIITGAIPYTLYIETACKVVGDPTFSEEDGVECVEWNMEAFFDSTWGKSTSVKIINAIATL